MQHYPNGEPLCSPLTSVYNRGMDERETQDSGRFDNRASQGRTAPSIAGAIFTALFNTALTLGAAALAFYVASFNLMRHGDNAIPLMLSVIAAFTAGGLMAWACGNRRTKPPVLPDSNRPHSRQFRALPERAIGGRYAAPSASEWDFILVPPPVS